MSSFLSSLPASSQPGLPLASSQLSATLRPTKNTKEYRPVKPLTYELKDITNVYIEEQLYSQALPLLMNTLIAGTDGTSTGGTLPAFIPPTQVFAVVATLTIHPSWTNRASEPDKVKTANDALFYLKHVNAIVGPTNANFSSAFQFLSGSDRRDRRRRAGDVMVNGEDAEKFQVDLATKGAVWNRAEDFWAVVGWAFNCSSQHPQRWERWKSWLEFMLDVLEDDLQEKIAASKAPAGEEKEAKILSESLIAQYCLTAGDGRAGKRRVMRAILANGSKKSLDEFGELWKNETKPPKKAKEEKGAERKKVDFEKEEYGDYMDMDDEEEEEEEYDLPSTPKAPTSARQSTRKRGRRASTASDAESTTGEDQFSDYGGAESINLRKRLIALLTQVSNLHEQAFMELEDCFDLLTEFIRPLPLFVFTQFVLPSTPYLEPHSHASLCQNLLRPTISSDAPVYHADTMRQAEFEKHFLPYAANYSNYVENCRVGLLVESLLRLLFRHAGLVVTEALKKGLEKGIKGREAKAAFGARKLVGSKEAEEERAVRMLRAGAQRMRVLVQVATGGVQI